LHKGAELIGIGNLDYHLDISTGDEIEELAEGFNQMAEGLKNQITEQIRLEQQMAEAEKLAAIGQLSAGIAHEINNPLSSIKMNLDILSRKMKPGGTDKERFDIARKEIEHLEELVRDILHYARPSGLNLTPGDINEVLAYTLRLVENHLKDKKVSIIKDYSNDLPMIHIDSGRLQQAMLNIFLNSIQAMDPKEGGRLSIKTAITTRSNTRMAMIEVSDNGCGIREEDMKKIFNPFFTTRRDGTGLGLPNTKTIIEQHKGIIEIESKAGEGTIVSIFLPAGRG
ncbi:MAG: HAMP domain-containing protein, partial [Deltaproteobacteria bacterium]|nr:HAMP domain-containing protein [Deltaproteobacteria bacterium]